MAPPRRAVPVAAPTAPGQLESSPVPPGLGLKAVSAAEGSLAYAGPPTLRGRLEAAGVTLIGLRHGQTEANALSESGPPIICGQSETPLTAKGRAQATEAAAQLLRQLGGDDYLRRAAADPDLLPVILSSPLSRALDTGTALSLLIQQRSQQLGCPVKLPVVRDERLLELNFGRFELKKVPELTKAHPDFTTGFDSYRGAGSDFCHRLPGGESRLDVTARVGSLLNEVVTRYPGRTVLLACHQETLVGARTALGLSKQRDGRVRADSQEIKNATPMWLVGHPR